MKSLRNHFWIWTPDTSIRCPEGVFVHCAEVQWSRIIKGAFCN